MAPRFNYVGHFLLDSKHPILLNIRPLDPATVAQPLPDAHSMATSDSRSGSMPPLILRPFD